MSGIFGERRIRPSIGGSKNNSQVIHCWAQGEGKTARGGNIRCADDILYSYSTMIARWYATPRGKVAIITSKRYSMTTSGKHMPRSAAFADDVASYRVETDVERLPDDWETAKHEILKLLVANVEQEIASLAKRRSVSDYTLAHVHGLAVDVQRFANAHDLTNYPQAISTSQFVTLRNSLDWINSFDPTLADSLRIKLEKTRIKEAKEKAVRNERDRIARLSQQERIELWRQGVYTGQLYQIPVMLRINGNEIETSHGARIPVSVAKRIWPKIQKRSLTPGEQIGEFRFTGFTYDLVVIGCHKIPMEEITAIAAELGLIGQATFAELRS